MHMLFIEIANFKKQKSSLQNNNRIAIRNRRTFSVLNIDKNRSKLFTCSVQIERSVESWHASFLPLSVLWAGFRNFGPCRDKQSKYSFLDVLIFCTLKNTPHYKGRIKLLEANVKLRNYVEVICNYKYYNVAFFGKEACKVVWNHMFYARLYAYVERNSAWQYNTW